MPDKWDEMTTRIQQGFLAEEPEAVMAAVFSVVAEIGRTMERIAIAMEVITEPEAPDALEDGNPLGPPPALDL